MRRMIAPLVLCLLACPLHAATVTTIAGTGVKGYSGDGGPASSAQVNNPYAVARGPDGALYICDVDNHRVRRILSNGTIETVAGSENKGYAGDGGPARQASLNMPYDMAWDSSGNLYFVELGNHCVRRVDAKSGIISTVAGNGKKGFAGDGGLAKDAVFNQPHSLAINPAGDLFVCDIGNHRIRRIDLKTGMISTWAGDGKPRTSADGSPITGSSLQGPRAIVFTPDGVAWVALREGNALLRLDHPKSNTLKRIAGTGKTGFTGNGGPALQATLSGPKAISVDAAGNVYFADTESHSIRFLNAKTGTIELLVGDGKKGPGPDGDPLKCELNRPHGVFVDQDGSIYIGDSENHRVRVWKK